MFDKWFLWADIQGQIGYFCVVWHKVMDSCNGNDDVRLFRSWVRINVILTVRSMERGGKCVTNQLLAGLPLEANRILGSSSSSHSQQFAWFVTRRFLGPWEDQYQKTGEEQGVHLSKIISRDGLFQERGASHWWLSSSSILKIVKPCISRFEVQKNNWSGVIILSKVVHRPSWGGNQGRGWGAWRRALSGVWWRPAWPGGRPSALRPGLCDGRVLSPISEIAPGQLDASPPKIEQQWG